MMWFVLILAIPIAITVHLVMVPKRCHMILRGNILLIGLSASIVFASVMGTYLTYPVLTVIATLLLIGNIFLFPWLQNILEDDLVTTKDVIHILTETIGITILVVGSLIVIETYYPGLHVLLVLLIMIVMSGVLTYLRWWLSHHMNIPFTIIIILFSLSGFFLYDRVQATPIIAEELQDMALIDRQEFVPIGRFPMISTDYPTDSVVMDGIRIHTHEEYVYIMDMDTGDYTPFSLSDTIVEYPHFNALFLYDENLYIVSHLGLYVRDGYDLIPLYEYEKEDGEEYLVDYYGALVGTEDGLLYVTQSETYLVDLQNHTLEETTMDAGTPDGFAPINVYNSLFYIALTGDGSYTGYYNSLGVQLAPHLNWTINDMDKVYSDVFSNTIIQHDGRPYVDWEYGVITPESINYQIDDFWFREREHYIFVDVSVERKNEDLNLTTGDERLEILKDYYVGSDYDYAFDELYLYTYESYSSRYLTVYHYEGVHAQFPSAYGYLFHPFVGLVLIVGVIPTVDRTWKRRSIQRIQQG